MQHGECVAYRQAVISSGLFKMMRRVLPYFWPVLVLMATFAQAGEIKRISGFHTPESVIVGDDGRIYVSEISDFNTHGDGRISVIDAQGSVQVFATGLDDPKGLAFFGGNLFVADKVRILKITPDGKWTVFASMDAFPDLPHYLNDLVADTRGNLYVSDSGNFSTGGAIYKIDRTGKVSLVIDGKKDSRILSPNGLIMDGYTHLLEVDFASGILYRVNVATGKMTKIAEGFGGGDGLVRGSNGRLYVSDFRGGKIFSVNPHGKVELLAEGFQQSSDMGMTPDGKTLVVPDMRTGEVIWLGIE